mmetsp:Transcript_2149/g.2993  ORF Transcript_2149/g.2993 Transcript_2149/m.2993 type:complete len:104 (+) Transcript_2149:988-1299(+)
MMTIFVSLIAHTQGIVLAGYKRSFIVNQGSVVLMSRHSTESYRASGSFLPPNTNSLSFKKQLEWKQRAKFNRSSLDHVLDMISNFKTSRETVILALPNNFFVS